LKIILNVGKRGEKMAKVQGQKSVGGGCRKNWDEPVKENWKKIPFLGKFKLWLNLRKSCKKGGLP